MVTHRGMREFILDTAESNHIPYQYFVSQGGTDAGQYIQQMMVFQALLLVFAHAIFTRQRPLFILMIMQLPRH